MAGAPTQSSTENLTHTGEWYKSRSPSLFISSAMGMNGSRLPTGWDAGILTLLIMRKSMEHGMILKDATVQYTVLSPADHCLWIPSFDWYDEAKLPDRLPAVLRDLPVPAAEKYTGVPPHHWLTMHPDGISPGSQFLLPCRFAGVYLMCSRVRLRRGKGKAHW